MKPEFEISETEAINNALDFVFNYKSPVKDKDIVKGKEEKIDKYKEIDSFDLLNNIFLHKCTKSKVELAVFIEQNKSRNNIETAYENIDKFSLPSLIELESLRNKAPYLFAERKQYSTAKTSEGKKKFVKYNKKIFLIRAYKCTDTSWGKIEITGTMGKKTDKLKLVKNMERGIRRIIKGIELSTKPYYFQGGTEFEPLNHYYKIKDYKNL